MTTNLLFFYWRLVVHYIEHESQSPPKVRCRRRASLSGRLVWSGREGVCGGDGGEMQPDGSFPLPRSFPPSPREPAKKRRRITTNYDHYFSLRLTRVSPFPSFPSFYCTSLPSPPHTTLSFPPPHGPHLSFLQKPPHVLQRRRLDLNLPIARDKTKFELPRLVMQCHRSIAGYQSLVNPSFPIISSTNNTFPILSRCKTKLGGGGGGTVHVPG